MDLRLFASHAHRLSARLSESLAERSKDLGLDPAYNLANPSSGAPRLPVLGHASALIGSLPPLWDRLPELASPEGQAHSLHLLASRAPPDRIEGLKRVLVMMCRNRAVLCFFPAVTNCLQSFPSNAVGPADPLLSFNAFAIRHLVSIYVLHHSRLSPDLALLSVNAWQKDLLDSSPAVRSLALRTLAGLGLVSVLPLVLVTIERLVHDVNWLVKRTVAEALISVLHLEPETYRQRIIDGPLRRLLNDRSPLVVGSALTAFEVICPRRWDLIHGQFRRLTSLLLDADEVGQLVLLRVLVRYVREHFTPSTHHAEAVDPGLETLLASASDLLSSRSSSVVVSAVYTVLYLAPCARWATVVRPLVRLIGEKGCGDQEESLLVVLQHLEHILQFSPQSNLLRLMSAHFQSLTIFIGSDPLPVKRVKLRILARFVALQDASITRKLIRELRFYTHDPDLQFVREVVRAVVELVSKTSGTEKRVGLDLLLELTRSPQHTTFSSSLEALRTLFMIDRRSRTDLLPELEKAAPRLLQALVNHSPNSDLARSNLYWLVAQVNLCSRTSNDQYIHFFKYSISHFVSEGIRSKLSILSLVAKSLLLCVIRRQDDHTLTSTLYDQRRVYQQGFEHLMRLARYDTNFRIRDRARFLQGLVASGSGLLLLDEPDSLLINVADFTDKQDAVVSPHEQVVLLPNDALSVHDRPKDGGILETRKMKLESLKEILLQDTVEPDTNVELLGHRIPSLANSLYDMVGSGEGGVSNGLDSCQNPDYSWKNIPPWTLHPWDPSTADPERPASGLQDLESMEISAGLKQYDDAANLPLAISSSLSSSLSYLQQPPREKIILVPTADGSASSNRVGGYRNLDEFLQSSDDEPSEEEDVEASDEEEEFTSGETGDDDDDDDDDESV